jgi:hypothetical protein
MDKLKDIGVEIVIMKGFAENHNPVVQSDIFRYWWLNNNGGFYLDTDQIILKSFETMPLKFDLLYTLYFNPQCGMYAPVGVIGCCKGSAVMDYVMKNIMRYYQSNNYNSTGPFMFIDILKRVDLSNAFNMPPVAWYPAQHSDMVGEIYNGNLELPTTSWALHWFGGHPVSQEFNKKYTEEFAKTSTDTVSKFLRDKNLI